MTGTVRRTLTHAALAVLAAGATFALLPATAHAAPVSYVEPGDRVIVKDTSGEMSVCSLGPYVQSNGVRGVMTAGHCGASGSPVYRERANGTLEPVSTIALSVDRSNIDAAFIPLRASQMNPYPVLPGGRRIVSGILPGSVVAAEGKITPSAGRVCSSGATSGERCGNALSTNYDGLTSSLFSDHGDSGSPVWTERDGEYFIVGLVRGVETSNPNISVIAPIEIMLPQINSTLLVRSKG